MIFDRITKNATPLTSAQLEALLRAGSGSVSGVVVNTTSAMRLATVYACVRVLAEAVGQLPCHLYRSTANGSDKARDHSLYGVLRDSPNSFQTAQEFWETVVTHLALSGNFYGFINRVRGEVREILPLNPSTVTIQQFPDYSLAYSIQFIGGRVETHPASSIFHVKLQSIDGVRGLSPIAQARESIGLGIATERHGARLFANGAKPGGVLKKDGKLSPEAAKRLKDQFDEVAGGDNLHGTLVLEEGLSYQQVSLSAEDSQFLETRKYQRSEIAGIFRVPPHLIGDLERSTFSNIEHQGMDFVTHALMPYLTRIESRTRMQLLRPSERPDYYAKFNAGGLLRGDMKSRAEFYTRQLQNGAMSPNEIRALEDMNPRDGGDVYLTPANMLIDGKAPTPPAAADPQDGGAA